MSNFLVPKLCMVTHHSVTLRVTLPLYRNWNHPVVGVSSVKATPSYIPKAFLIHPRQK